MPGIASAQEPDHFKTLVVRADNTAATKKAITTISKSGNEATAGYKFTVDAPLPADVDDLFTEEGLGEYNAVVLLNTGASFTLTADQKQAFEDYFHLGGGLVVIGTAIETEPSWTFLSDAIGARATGAKLAVQDGTVKVFDQVHDATKKLPEYWDRTDAWYNYPNVTGKSHVLAAVVEYPFEKQPQGKVLEGIEGGTMVDNTDIDLGNDHPVSWCKDYQGGRSFYTSLGQTQDSWDGGLRKHMTGAIGWAGGFADPEYSDCGATVLANYQQVRLSAQPNINEPIGFDQLPDGRIIQTDRRGTIRLHDPVAGTTTVLADFANASLPMTQQIYAEREDGMYGPAVDPDFDTNHWVYLFYSPREVTNVELSDGSIAPSMITPLGENPNASSATLSVWDAYVGYFQLSRFKFVETPTPHLDLTTEQEILRVSQNRGECCHVAGDIDFDSKGNLWMVTGDDTPAGGIQGGGVGPQNDQKTDEQQTVRVNTGATAGTFTLTFNGQTTAPIAYNATGGTIDAALEALSNIAANEVQVSGGPVNTANVNVFFRRGLSQSDQPLMTSDATGLTTTATPPITHNTPVSGGLYQRPSADARRSALNTNDLRGKVLRFKVKSGDIIPAEENKGSFNGSPGAYTIPSGNLFPLVGGQPQGNTRPEIYAMGFRNPFRINLDDKDDAYVSDYSPDANSPVLGRGPAGTGRYEFVRKPANYGWPICMSTELPSFRWEHHEFTQPGSIPNGTPAAGQANTTTQGIQDPDLPPYTAWDCDGASVPNISYWNLNGGPSVEPGLVNTPPLTDPDIWYSYQDNASQLRGTPCVDNYDAQALTDPPAPGSNSPCPRLFPELYTEGVGPHGSDKYDYDSDLDSDVKFPPYYDQSVIVGEFTEDTMREVKLDKDKDVFKINSFFPCDNLTLTTPIRPFDCDNPMDMQWGDDDGAFYLLTYGQGNFNINPGAAMYRWEYVKGERAPKVNLTTDKTNGSTPLTVQFSSEGTMDPDPGDSITFDWNFGDGTPHSSEPNPSHTYTTAGQYTAVLTVSDSSGKSAAQSTIITVGNNAPTVTVTVPVEGGTFNFGDNIPYTVTVTDPEDGVVNCAEVTTTFVLSHDEHGHPGDSDTGCSGTLQTDANDVFHGGVVFGTISASYTDHGGPGGVPSLSAIDQTGIRQKAQEAENVLAQSGTNTGNNIDGGAFSGPPAAGIHRGSLGAGDWIKLNGPFNLVNISDITYRVADTAAGRTAGSPLAAVEVRQDDPATGTILATHNLVSTGGTAVWTNQTFPISMTGTHEIYLVFRAVTGGQTGNNLFNLNWTRFGGGNGVGVPVP